MSDILVTCAYDLSVSTDADGTWIQVFPAGTSHARDGRGPYHLTDANQVITASRQAAHGADLVIDYEHQTEIAKKIGGPAPASGWITDLAARDDGIWAKVNWTNAASKMIAEKEYRFFSPTFHIDLTGRVIRILRGSLTNTPNLDLPPVTASQQDTHMDLLKEVCNLLGLPDTTTPEQLLSHIKTMQGDLQTVACSMGMTNWQGKTADLITASQTLVTASQQTVPDPRHFVPMTTFTDVVGQLSELKKTQQGSQIEQIVTAAMQNGKISPGMKDWATDFATRDLASFRDFVSKMPAIVTVTASTHHVSPPPAASTLTPEQQEVARQLGLTAETFSKGK